MDITEEKTRRRRTIHCSGGEEILRFAVLFKVMRICHDNPFQYDLAYLKYVTKECLTVVNGREM